MNEKIVKAITKAIKKGRGEKFMEEKDILRAGE